MFGKIQMQWVAGTALIMAMAPSLAGGGVASAQTISANVSGTDTVTAMQLTATNNAPVAPGTIITINGSGYGVSEPVGFWINVPAGTAISENSLGQIDTQVVGTVVPLDAMGTTDEAGVFSYSLDTTGLPDGTYSLVAHGLRSGMDGVFSFTVKAAPALQITADASAPVAAGTMLTIQVTSFRANEAAGLWINVPSGTAISETSLGQSDTKIVGTVIPLDAPGYADASGVLSYTLDTTGLPSGSYSLVVQGLESGLQGVLSFSIK